MNHPFHGFTNTCTASEKLLVGSYSDRCCPFQALELVKILPVTRTKGKYHFPKFN